MEKRRNQLALYQLAEIKVSYVMASERPVITGAKNAFEILMDSWDQGKFQYVELFKVILLSRGNRVLGILEASTGGVSGAASQVSNATSKKLSVALFATGCRTSVGSSLLKDIFLISMGK